MRTDFKPYLGALGHLAFKAEQSRGRRQLEGYENFIANDDDQPYHDCMDPFHLDRLKILGSKSFRRLGDKTQVFIDHNSNGHVRTRRVHTDEVYILSSTIASILGLNVGLAEAIALGHDLGHTPFGHPGERMVAKLSGKEFRHEIMSVVACQHLERSGRGLNLSYEVLEGILHHSRGGKEMTLENNLPAEYTIVMYADKIAYTFSDLNDGVRMGFFQANGLRPPDELNSLGSNQRQRWYSCILALVKESSELGYVSFANSETAKLFASVRSWSYQNFYKLLDLKGQRKEAKDGLASVYSLLQEAAEIDDFDPLLALAILTDHEAMEIWEKFGKNPCLSGRSLSMKEIERIRRMSFMEILSRLPKEKTVDIFDPDLKPRYWEEKSLA